MNGMTSLQRVLPWISNGVLVGNPQLDFSRVHTDTRNLQAGDLFVALRGERFDAHDFLVRARTDGAVAAIAERGLEPAGLPGIVVPDSRLALGQLATGWRAQFNLPLIAVTGSNGKTTVTQMIAAILRAHDGEAAFATQGNLNNDIGLPLTLLRLNAAHRMAVVELGMNHPGEIAYLARIARPTVALVNNAQREHQEFMATVDAVAHENGAVIAALPQDGVAIFPSDDPFAGLWRSLAASRRCMTFALDGSADVLLKNAVWQGDAWQVQAQTPVGIVSLRLNIAGLHNVKNALAAVAAALAANISLAAIARGLACFEPVKGRSRALQFNWRGRQITVVDDTYNANPDSVQAAIDVLAALPGPHLLVLGDMGEVGDKGPEFHAEAGIHARSAGIEALLTLGDLSAQTVQTFTDHAGHKTAHSAASSSCHFSNMEPLLAAVLAQLEHVGSVLVKGSRFMKMERVVEAIAAAATPVKPQLQETRS